MDKDRRAGSAKDWAGKAEMAGRPDGRDREFGHAAELELNAESESPDAPTEMTQPNENSFPG